MDGGQKIAELRSARGWSRPALAERMGTTPQQLERLEKGQRKLTLDWIARAAQALEIDQQIIIDAASPPAQAVKSNATPFRYEGAGNETLRNDLPIYGTALGAPRMIENDQVEQTYLNSGEVVEYIKRPVVLNGKSDAYGLHVVGGSMWPMYPEGSIIIAETRRPPMIGDDVVVYLRDLDCDDDSRVRCVLVKRLVRRTAAYVELQQFDPMVTFQVSTDEVLRIDRVMTLRDLLS
jgi:phage repressor protein C with HTH and peptisase S24 domain